jgi:peptide/nickel transport system permease protein
MQALELAVRFREDLSGFRSVTPADVEPSVDPKTPISTDISPDIETSIDMEMPNALGGIAIEMEVSVDVEITPEQDVPDEQGTSTKPEVVHINTPWWGEFVGWMTAFFRGDLGKSRGLGSKLVTEILKITLPRTLLLLIPGTIGGFILGMWLGKLVAWQPRGWLEFAATLGGTAFYTSFAPWLAFVMISVFGLYFDWFPPEKLIDPIKWFRVDITLNDVIAKLLITMVLGILAYLIVVWLTRDFAHRKSILWRLIGGTGIIILATIPWIINGLWVLALDILNHMVLPLSTLILLSFGETMLIMKTTMTEAVVAEHVSVARAKGLPDAQVRDRHAARVAILPVLTRFIVHLPFIIIGSFVIEHFYYWDGMGQELIRAANENDLPVMLGVLSVVAIGILLAHTTLDILTVWLDPRLRKIEQIRRFAGRVD